MLKHLCQTIDIKKVIIWHGHDRFIKKRFINRWMYHLNFNVLIWEINFFYLFFRTFTIGIHNIIASRLTISTTKYWRYFFIESSLPSLHISHVFFIERSNIMHRLMKIDFFEYSLWNINIFCYGIRWNQNISILFPQCTDKFMG